MIHLKEVSKVYTLNDPAEGKQIDVIVGKFEDEEGRTYDHVLLKDKLHLFYDDKEMTIPKKLDGTIQGLIDDDKFRRKL